MTFAQGHCHVETAKFHQQSVWVKKNTHNKDDIGQFYYIDTLKFRWNLPSAYLKVKKWWKLGQWRMFFFKKVHSGCQWWAFLKPTYWPSETSRITQGVNVSCTFWDKCSLTMKGRWWPHKERIRTSLFCWLGVQLSAEHHAKVAPLLSHTNTYEGQDSYRKEDQQIARTAGGGKRNLSSWRRLPKVHTDFSSVNNIQRCHKLKNCFTPLAPFYNSARQNFVNKVQYLKRTFLKCIQTFHSPRHSESELHLEACWSCSEAY